MHTELHHGAIQKLGDRAQVIYQKPRNCSAVTVQNRGDSICYLGGENVTAESGLALAPGAMVTFTDTENPYKLWGMADVGGKVSVIHYLRQGAPERS